MGHYHLRDYRHRPVYSCCPPSDTYNSYPYRVRKGRQVLRASHPNIHLVPKPFFSMVCPPSVHFGASADSVASKQNISNIWLIEKGLINGQEKPDIQLLAMWDPGYACNVIHESVVKHLPRQAAETSTVGSYTVFARLNLDWTNSDHPENGWRTRHHPFYVTTQAMPKGVKVIIGSKSGSESPEATMRDMAAPVHGPVPTPS